jgi:hypothetical protein
MRSLAQGMYDTGDYYTTVNGLSGGVYLCQLNAAGFRSTRTLVVR